MNTQDVDKIINEFLRKYTATEILENDTLKMDLRNSMVAALKEQLIREFDEIDKRSV